MADPDAHADPENGESAAEAEPKNSKSASEAEPKNAKSAPAKDSKKKAPAGKRRVKLPGTADVKSRWPTFLTLALAVIAVAVAVAAWFRPAHSSAPKYSAEQVATAKANVCSAYAEMHKAVVRSTNLPPPNGDDPAGYLAVGTNARLALLGGAQYLRTRLAAEPAAPADLANAITSMATIAENLGMGYLSGASGFAQDAVLHDLNDDFTKINQLCA